MEPLNNKNDIESSNAHVNELAAASMYEALLKAQRSAFQNAMADRSLAEALQPMIDAIISHTEGQATASFYQVSENTDQLDLIVSGSADHALDVNGSEEGLNLSERPLNMYTHGPIITRNIEIDPLWLRSIKMTADHNYRACWLFPLQTEGEALLGVLAIFHEQSRDPKPTELEVAKVVAHTATIILSRNTESRDRTRAEIALRQREEQLRALFDATSNMLYKMNADWRQMYILDGKNVLADTDEPTGNWIDIYIPESERAQVWEAIEHAIRNKTTFELEHKVIRANGSIGWVLSRAIPVIDANGDVKEWFGAANDITLRKNAEIALQLLNERLEDDVIQRTSDLDESRALLQATLDSNAEMIQVFKAVRNNEGKIVDFIWILNNITSEQFYGDVIGKSLLKENPGVLGAGIFNSFVRVVESGIPQRYEKRYVFEQFDGWFYQSVVKLNDGIATTTVNVTDRKKAELLLEESRDQLRSILDTTLVQMSILEAVRDHDDTIIDLKIIAVNQQLEKETGRNDLIGKLYGQEYPGIKPTGLFDLIIKTIETGVAQSTEYFYEHEGFRKWYTCSFAKYNDGVVATNMDISARKVTEEQLKRIEAEKQREIFEVSLSTLEEERHRISESLHNGVGQILYGIKISLGGLRQELPSQEFDQIRNYTNKLLSDAIIETRRVSHELMPTTLEEFGLKAAIDDVCEQLRNGVELRTKISGPQHHLDKYMELAVYRTIQELLMNVLKHAQATSAELELKIDNTQVVIKVSDNGVGIDASNTQRPGIGLASIRSKVKLLNGDVQVRSEIGEGTHIEVRIPLPAIHRSSK